MMLPWTIMIGALYSKMIFLSNMINNFTPANFIISQKSCKIILKKYNENHVIQIIENKY